MLDSLHTMVMGNRSCVVPLLWATLILLLVQYAFGVFLVSVVVNHLQVLHTSSYADERTFIDGIDDRFGTIFKAFCTLSELVTGGRDWGMLSQMLKEISKGYYVAFGLYIVFVTLGVFNIVTGFFVDSSLQVSEDYRSALLQDAETKKTAMLEVLRELFHELDSDASGSLSLEEFESRLDDESLTAHFCVLEIDPVEAKEIFLLLDSDSSGSVSIDKFVDGCMGILGGAKSRDIKTCIMQGKKIMVMLEGMALQKY